MGGQFKFCSGATFEKASFSGGPYFIENKVLVLVLTFIWLEEHFRFNFPPEVSADL